MLQEPVVSFEDRFNPLKCYIKWRRSSYYGIPYPNPPGPIGFGTNTRSGSLAFVSDDLHATSRESAWRRCNRQKRSRTSRSLSPGSRNQDCRFWKAGKCHRGSECAFQQPPKPAAPSSKDDKRGKSKKTRARTHSSTNATTTRAQSNNWPARSAHAPGAAKPGFRRFACHPPQQNESVPNTTLFSSGVDSGRPSFSHWSE